MVNYQEIENMLEASEKTRYPKIGAIEPNPCYGKMLYDSFAGELGELTAATKYIYESLEEKEEEKLSRILERIAIQEMKHLKILGSIIKKMRMIPWYKDTNGQLWTAENVPYESKNRKEMFKRNILAEQEAIRGYIKAMRYTNNRELQALFCRIIEDEKNHIEIFRRLLQEEK